MTLYTPMPLELVLEGIHEQRGPYMELMIEGMLMQVEPVQPGIGKIVRVIDGPLYGYLHPQFEPGRLIAYGDQRKPS
jgi:hypothetical protein